MTVSEKIDQLTNDLIAFKEIREKGKFDDDGNVAKQLDAKIEELSAQIEGLADDERITSAINTHIANEVFWD